MDKYGVKSAGCGKAGAVGKLDGKDHGVPRQRHDSSGVVPGERPLGENVLLLAAPAV